jgi:uncharacterized phosphosugar-binding protein
MQFKPSVFLLTLVTPLFLGTIRPALAADSPASTFAQAVIKALDHNSQVVDQTVRPAETAAARVISGGRIFVTDDETITRTGKEKTTLYKGGGHQYPMHEDWGGFVAEACDRAGGFRLIQPVPVDGKVGSKDVVLSGTLDLHPEEQVKQIAALRKSGALVILFGSKQSRVAEAADFLIDNGLPAGTVPVLTARGKNGKTGPIAGIVNVANMWAFTAEFVAAATRKGKLPTMYQSMLVPGAAKRNEHAEKGWFYPDVKVAPIPAGKLGREFLGQTQGYLRKITETELPKFRAAGTLCAGAIKSRHKVVASVIGHFMTTQMRMPGFPAIFEVKANQYGADYLKGSLKGGDVWLHVGYCFYPLDQIKYVRSTGAKLIGELCPGPTEVDEGPPVPIDTRLFDIYIDPYWRFGDGAIKIPGFDVAIIPVSGVVMISSFWMILGETLNQLDS